MIDLLKAGVIASMFAFAGSACSSPRSGTAVDRPPQVVLTLDTTFDLPFEARTSLAWLDSTHLAIIDADAKQVVRLGLDGTVKRVGGPGSGPGEFRLPLQVFRNAEGEPLVFDPLARQIHRFDRALRPRAVLATVRLGNRIIGDRGDSLVMMWQVYPADSLGRRIGAISPTGVVSPDPLPLGTIDPVFSEVAELAPGQNVQNPEAVTRRDGRIVLGESRDYRLWLLSPNGQVLRTGGRPSLPDLDETELSESDVQAELGRAKRITQDAEMLKQIEASIRRRLSSPHYKFRHMIVDAQLRTWVLADRGPPDSTQVDLFDADLGYLGTLPLPGELWAIAVEGDRVAVLSGSPSDSPWKLIVYFTHPLVGH